MRSFHIPFDMHTEDKIIGGYLSLRQLAWLAIGALCVIFLFGMDQSYITSDGVNGLKVGIRIVISLFVCGFVLVMAFATFNEIEADKYLFKKIAYKIKPKVIRYTDRKK